MKPTNAKGIARLFLKSLFEELGESEKSMKPMEYSALATRIGLTNSEMQSAISQLKRDLLIRFDPESTQIIRLTTKGIQEGSSLRFRNEHPEISDPLPDSLDGVDAEINYFAQLVAECLPGSNDWEWITERLKNLRYRHSTMLKQSEPSTVYHQQITQHGGVMNASQTGNVAAQQLTVGELNDLRPALAEVRSAFKKQDSIDADEYVGLLASAEKAAKEGNENKVLGFLKQIPEKAWDVGKVVIPQMLLSYLKSRGIIQ